MAFFSSLVSKQKLISENRITSFAGGIAVAYVFLHMLPELVEGNNEFKLMLHHAGFTTPFFDLTIFLVALLGFNLYFGFEKLASRTVLIDKIRVQRIYRLNIFMYCLYNFLITYTMPTRIKTGFLYAIIFTLVMSLHFIMINQKFHRYTNVHFVKFGRLLLLGSLFLGWLLSILSTSVNALLANFMIAFLAGAILYNAFAKELPTTKKESFGAFILGICVITIVLLVMLGMKH